MKLLTRARRLLVSALAGLGTLTAFAQQPPHAQLVVQLGHKSDVRAATFSADGKLVLTAGDDGTAKLWEAATGREVRVFAIPRSIVLSADISRDERYVLTSEYPHSARLWDAASGKELRRFDGGTGQVESVSFSRDGRYLLTAGGRKAVLWDLPTGKKVQEFETVPGMVASAAITSDSRSVLTGGGKKVSMWDVATGKLLWQYVSTTESVWAVAISSDGSKVLAGGQGETPNGKYPGVAFLLDATTGRVMKHFTGHSHAVTSVGFSRTGATAVTGSNDWTARGWDIASGRQLFSIDEGMNVHAVELSSNGRTLLVAGFGQATLWDVTTGRRSRNLLGDPEPIEHFSFADNGDYLLTGGPGDGEQLWDVRTGRLVQWFKGQFSQEWSLSLAAGGGYRLQTRAGEAQPMPAGWFDEPSGWMGPPKMRGVPSIGYFDSENPDEYSPDNKTSAHDTETEQAVSYIPSWACGSDDENLPIGKLQATASGPLEFSSGCRFAALGEKDGTTRIWDVQSGRELATLIAFTNGGWVVTDPEGRFDTNQLDGGAPMQWVVSDDPMRPLPLEIFMRDYYTPRLLARIINGETLPPVRSIAEITNRVQPDAAVVSVTASKTHPGRANVVVHAASHTNERGQASGLGDLRLFRNGQMVGYREGEQKDGDFTFPDIQLPTSVKTVTFTAYAFNSMNIKSATAQKDFAYEPGPPAKPHAYLLQIGVNHYRASNCELHGSATDAEELSGVLTDRLTKRGLDVKPALLVSTLTENGATKEKIHNALQAIAAVATPDDVFFLSFSGHGYGDRDGQFYILPSDVEGSCQGVDHAMLRQAVSADELADWLRPIDAGEMTFILDSCQSASSVEANDFKPGPMGSRGLGQLAYDKRMRILAASQSNQEAQERNLPVVSGAGEERTQGLLSYALTEEGLVEGKADWKPVDQKITVGEWLSYAADAVPKSLESGAVKTTRGMTRIGAPTPHAKSAQIPAVFDFSKRDTFVLQ
jgi:WD40 repeat protein